MKKTIIIATITAGALIALTAAAYHILHRSGPEPVHPPVPDKDDTDGMTMLVEFARYTVATVGGDGYEKTSLWADNEGGYLLLVSERYDGDEAEKRTFYRADAGAADSVYSLISEYDLIHWNDKCPDSFLDGASYSLTFITSDGETVRVSSDRMPENGISLMREIEKCMKEHADMAVPMP